MTGIFKQKGPGTLLLLSLMGILVKLPMFLAPYRPVLKPSDGLLFEKMLDLLTPTGNSYPILFPLLAYLLLLSQAIQLTAIINNQRMMILSGYLPGLAYLLLTSLLPEWNHFSAPLVVNTILLYVFKTILKIYNQPNAKGLLFNIGLAIGIASFLFISSFSFILWALIGIGILRSFRLNEWLLCLLGCITPFYFFAVYLLWMDSLNPQSLLPHLSLGLPILKQSEWLLPGLLLLAAGLLLGIIVVQGNMRRVLIQVRKDWRVLFAFLFIALVLPFINTDHSFENWIVPLIPLATFHSGAYLYTKPRFIGIVLCWITIAYILGYQYIGPGW